MLTGACYVTRILLFKVNSVLNAWHIPFKCRFIIGPDVVVYMCQGCSKSSNLCLNVIYWGIKGSLVFHVTLAWWFDFHTFFFHFLVAKWQTTLSVSSLQQSYSILKTLKKLFFNYSNDFPQLLSQFWTYPLICVLRFPHEESHGHSWVGKVQYTLLLCDHG